MLKKYFIVLLVFGLLYVNSNALISYSPPTLSLTLEDYDSAILPGRKVCGSIKATKRIIGGKAVEMGELPWTVAIEYSSTSTPSNESGVKCAGSLINQRYVLTSANCVTSKFLKPDNAILGEWKLSSDPDCLNANVKECADPVKKIKIREVIVHEQYSARNKTNDIALIRLDKDVEYTEFISPICLPPKNLPFPLDGKRVTVAGWGVTETGEQSDILLKVDLPIVSRTECGPKINRTISENMFCAGGEAGKDSCQGDSGSSAIFVYGDEVNKARWYQCGIVSYGVGCGRAGYAAIYTNVEKYVGWIVSNIKAH